MGDSVYPGASNGTTLMVVDRYGIPVSACLAKSPIYGNALYQS